MTQSPNGCSPSFPKNPRDTIRPVALTLRHVRWVEEEPRT
jgi:hypothetical protein